MAKGEEKETTSEAQPEWLEEEEGQLAIDVFQTPDEIVLQAPIAGVSPEDLDVTITDDVVTIQGTRKQREEVRGEHYFTQECYWGSFSRSYQLPVPVNSERAKASYKDGILTITIPKDERTKTRVLKIQKEE